MLYFVPVGGIDAAGTLDLVYFSFLTTGARGTWNSKGRDGIFQPFCAAKKARAEVKGR